MSNGDGTPAPKSPHEGKSTGELIKTLGEALDNERDLNQKNMDIVASIEWDIDAVSTSIAYHKNFEGKDTSKQEKEIEELKPIIEKIKEIDKEISDICNRKVKKFGTVKNLWDRL